MLKPFFQGKLDTFCAIYAVLNALRLTHGIQTLKARDILNETLLSLAGKPGALRAVLEQDTDYMQLVDDMIQARQQRYPLLVEKPFAEGEAVSPDALWEACREWLAPGEGRCILFRFLRHGRGPAASFRLQPRGRSRDADPARKLRDPQRRRAAGTPAGHPAQQPTLFGPAVARPRLLARHLPVPPRSSGRSRTAAPLPPGTAYPVACATISRNL